MEKQIEQKVKPEEQKRHLIKAYLDDEEYEKFQLFAKACKCTNSNFVRQLLAGAHLVAFLKRPCNPNRYGLDARPFLHL